jgi:hypothetical protein
MRIRERAAGCDDPRRVQLLPVSRCARRTPARLGGWSSTASEQVRDFSEVLQGKIDLRVAADARSAEVRRTTDPPTVRAVAFGEDAELGRIANDPGFEAKNAFDGDLATEWSSNGDGNAAFLSIDLGAPRSITGVAFRTREMADGSAITRSFTVTVDGKTTLGPFPAGDRRIARAATVSATGRRLRFDLVNSTGGNTGADEIRGLHGGGLRLACHQNESLPAARGSRRVESNIQLFLEGAPRVHENARRGDSRLPATGSNRHDYAETV